MTQAVKNLYCSAYYLINLFLQEQIRVHSCSFVVSFLILENLVGDRLHQRLRLGVGRR